MSQPLIEVNGQKYMNTKTAAKLWQLNCRTVTNYCKNKRITNCFKQSNRSWYIHIDEMKPLTHQELRKILSLTLQLKNRPTLEIDWTTFEIDESSISFLYSNLAQQGYIEPFNVINTRRIPYEVKLTQKGLDIVLGSSSKEMPDASTVIQQWIPIMVNIAQLLVAIKAL